jgi:hypothetical protein
LQDDNNANEFGEKKWERKVPKVWKPRKSLEQKNPKKKEKQKRKKRK